MRHPRILALAAAAVALAAAIAPATAAAAGHAPRPPAITRPGSTFGGEVLCNGHSQCITNKNGLVAAGNPISGSTLTRNANQHWDLVLTGSCGDGHVHSSTSCPFAAGSGLNAQLDGDPIVTMCLDEFPDRCTAVNSPSTSGAVTLQVAPATGTNYVLDGSTFINEARTKAVGAVRLLVGDGVPGDQLTAGSSGFGVWTPA